MTAKITPLTTEHLRLMRDDIAEFRKEVREELTTINKKLDAGLTDIKKRLSRVEQTMVGLKRDEAEMRAALAAPGKRPSGATPHEHLATRIRKRFAAAGDVDLPPTPRTVARRFIKF